jgi:chromosome partitioning protein
MARVIVVANQKGGVGKTTTVVNLGVALSQLGQRVALVDMDSQGALRVSFGFDPYQIKPSTYDLLFSAEVTFPQVLRQVEGGLGVAPANAELVAAEYQLLRQPRRAERLRVAIAPHKEAYEFVLIDTPPGLGLLTINGLVAADELLIPVATDYLAMRGVRSLLESVWLIRERVNPELQLLGLVPTMFQNGSKHARVVVAEMRKVFHHKVSRTVIPLDEAARAAPAARRPVVDYQPESAVSRAYKRLAEEVCDGVS